VSDLPVLGAPRPERADAARNRAKVLRAARRLVARRGVENVTIEEIAKASRLSKGTVFHRFGDRSGLLQALLDDGERDLQDRILRGPPPLGPGAEPGARLEAFLDALLHLTLEDADLLIAADAGRPGGRYVTGAYAAWHQHVALLLSEMRPGADANPLSHVLLAPLDAQLVRHLRQETAIEPGELRGAVHELAARLGSG
jgi:AcrR family transcriptional regulator